jgi:hypothetical protein
MTAITSAKSVNDDVSYYAKLSSPFQLFNLSYIEIAEERRETEQNEE